MFVIATTRTFDWPVDIRLPSPDEAGAIVTQTFTATFEAIPLAEAASIEAGVAAGPLGAAEGQAALIRRVLKGWRDIVDEKGEAVAFTAEIVDAVCGEPWFRTGVIRAYAQAMSGEEARRKN